MGGGAFTRLLDIVGGKTETSELLNYTADDIIERNVLGNFCSIQLNNIYH